MDERDYRVSSGVCGTPHQQGPCAALSQVACIRDARTGSRLARRARYGPRALPATLPLSVVDEPLPTRRLQALVLNVAVTRDRACARRLSCKATGIEWCRRRSSSLALTAGTRGASSAACASGRERSGRFADSRRRFGSIRSEVNPMGSGAIVRNQPKLAAWRPTSRTCVIRRPSTFPTSRTAERSASPKLAASRSKSMW